MLSIDLNIRFIDERQKIWVVHPGHGRRFFENFWRNSHVFLEIPGLNLNKDALENTDTVRKHLRMALALRTYHSSQQATSVPSNNPSRYGSDGDDDKSFYSNVGNVLNLFGRASPGDLVITCGYGQYEPVLFGEFTGEFDPKHKLTLDGSLGYAEINYRPVKWTSTNYARRDIPANLSKYIVNRHAIVELHKSELFNQIYRFAYPAFSADQISKIDILGPKYTGTKLFETYTSERLVAYLISVYTAIESGKTDLIGKLSVDDLIQAYPSDGLIDGFDQDFHSPGKQTLFSRRTALAAFVSAGIGVATLSVTPNEFSQMVSSPSSPIDVSNSAGGNSGETTKNVKDGLEYFLNSLGNNSERAKEFKETGDKANDVIGVKSPTSVSIK